MRGPGPAAGICRRARAGQNYLYALANGLSPIVGYRAGADGSLTQVTSAPGRRRLRRHRRQLKPPIPGSDGLPASREDR